MELCGIAIDRGASGLEQLVLPKAPAQEPYWGNAGIPCGLRIERCIANHECLLRRVLRFAERDFDQVGMRLLTIDVLPTSNDTHKFRNSGQRQVMAEFILRATRNQS